MLASRTGGSFSILEAVLQSHFWGGVKSDLFTGSVFGVWRGKTGKVYKSPQWSAIQLGSSVLRRDGARCVQYS